MMEMNGIDLFAGAGGMSLGARCAGVDVKFAVENDHHAAMTYSENHPNTDLFEGDIRNVNGSKLAKLKLLSRPLVLFGGPPCQGFSWSNARTRSLANENNWLFQEFLRIANFVEPEWLVFENVQGVVDTAGGVFLQKLEQSLRQMGYECSTSKLNAANYGVPQNRTRFFLVASRNNKAFAFPPPQNSCITVDDAIRDLPKLLNGHSRSWMPYGRKKPSAYALDLRTISAGCENHLVSANSDLVLQRYSHIPKGGNWANIPESLMKNYKDRTRCHTGIYHRLNPCEPSVVIGNYRKNMLIHPDQDRGLSVREAARLQSFPDSYLFCGSVGFQQQQVGNAVPPKLAEQVFTSLLKAQTNKRGARSS